MKGYLLSILFCCFISFSFSQNTSSIDFVIKNLGINVDGHFNTFTVTADIDSKGNLNTISGKIKVSSIRTGMESRDEHLLKEDYFDIENHESIVLESMSLNKKTDNLYAVSANLTIKGITKAVSIKVNVEKTNDTFKITSSFDINRKDFKVGGSSFVLSKTVRINVTHYEKL